MSTGSYAFALGAAMCLAATALAAQDVTKEEVAGVRNFARLKTTVACAGATGVEALPAIKQMGFVSVINLRLATEPGAEVEKEEAAARAAGLQYYHVPFAGKPDPAAAEAFLKAITTTGAEPAFIHCGGGNRAATMWLIKRIAIDKWDPEKAVKEAEALGQTNQDLRKWAVEFAQARK
jgi:uncharacterized protein (TIGR01244 family)